MEQWPRPPRLGAALALFTALVVIYNSNGREVGTYDSQAAKFTAREVAVRHTLVLDHVVAEFPGLADRPAFARDRAGYVRSAYPILPALLASVPAVVAQTTGLVDMDAPGAPSLIAVFTASLSTAAAAALTLIAVGRIVPPRAALLAAVSLGLGTNYWPLVSRTLWAHETVALGLALALWAWLRSPNDIGALELIAGGAGLAMAGAARPQVAPLVAVMAMWLAWRVGIRRALGPFAIIAAAAAAVMLTNFWWFGHALGATPALYSSQETGAHATTGVLNPQPWVGAAGLLVSPSRGLLVFSPVWIIGLVGLTPAWRADRALGLPWLVSAALVQFIVYSCFSVWWGGHTYGPRYVLDVLVPLSPFLGLGFARMLGGRATSWLSVTLLAGSIAVAALGAFVYPNERWNTDPVDVDRNHERLWNAVDSQIPRALAGPVSPQNFDLFTRAALRRPPG